MNQTLKFSFGNVLAFLALIAVSYASFVGYAYLSDGNFYFAIAGMVLTDIVYFFWFMAAQWLKADGEKIHKKIVWERILIYGSPLIFAGCMVGIAHFWTVRSQDTELVENFKSSINNSKQMFSDYENYANQRIMNYDKALSKIINEKQHNPKAFQDAGFLSGKENIQKNNMLQVLRLQLLPENYTRLKESANQWIEESSQGASTWNVFLIGNTRQIKKAVENWNEELKEMSSKKMFNEEVAGKVPDFSSNGLNMASQGLDDLTTTFGKWKYPVWQVFFFGAIIYFLLLFPYLLQPRHTRQVAAGYTLFKTKKSKNTLEPRSMPEIPKTAPRAPQPPGTPQATQFPPVPPVSPQTESAPNPGEMNSPAGEGKADEGGASSKAQARRERMRQLRRTNFSDKSN